MVGETTGVIVPVFVIVGDGVGVGIILNICMASIVGLSALPCEKFIVSSPPVTVTVNVSSTA